MPPPRPLDRRTAGAAAPPRRLVHLGVGAFHRAHQAWYTHRLNALDGAGEPLWGIAAFTGRGPAAALALQAQDGLYTLITRGPAGDSAELIASVVAATDGADRLAWLDAMSDPAVAALTLTVTESGYLRSPHGLDLDQPDARADIAALRATTGAPSTPPGRVLDGLRARLRAGAGRLVVISCDNLPDNSEALRQAVLALAEQVDPGLVGAIEAGIEFASCVVDRITPATSAQAARVAEKATGFADAIPVVTEPFSEWIIAARPGPGWPRWDRVGVRFVDDVAPYEQRKLRLLNGAHSLLAYRGLARGHQTIAGALVDERCRAELEQYWAEARVTVALPAAEIEDYLAALRERFANPRIEHRLDQIALDGAHKLANRVVPVVRAQRERDGVAGPATLGVIAAYASWRGQPLPDTLGELGL